MILRLMSLGVWPVARNTFSHQHASPRRRFKHFVNTFDLERRALLVSSSPDCTSYTLPLFPGYPWAGVVGSVWMFDRWP